MAKPVHIRGDEHISIDLLPGQPFVFKALCIGKYSPATFRVTYKGGARDMAVYTHKSVKVPSMQRSETKHFNPDVFTVYATKRAPRFELPEINVALVSEQGLNCSIELSFAE